MNNFIKSPCSENWDSMQNWEKGKYCEVCSKNVFDFSKLNSNEIEQTLKTNSSVCARIPLTKKNSIIISARDLLSINTSFMNIIRILILILCLNVTISCSDTGEKKTLYYSEKNDTLNFVEGVLISPDSISEHPESGSIKGQDGIYLVCEEMPSFKKKGLDGLKEYLQKNIIYPKDAIDSNIQGKVFVSFIIDTSGKIRDSKILRSPQNCKALEIEALRVVNKMPKWNPGKDKGKKVEVQFNLPINFSLD